jgi:hypothetical protein
MRSALCNVFFVVWITDETKIVRTTAKTSSLVQDEGRVRQDLCRRQQAHSGQEAPYGLPERRLSQPTRVLELRHSHLYDPGAFLPGLTAMSRAGSPMLWLHWTCAMQ